MISPMRAFKTAINLGLVALALYMVHLDTGLLRSYSNDQALIDAGVQTKQIKDPFDAAQSLDQAYRKIYKGTVGPYGHCTVCYSDEIYAAEKTQLTIDSLMIDAIAHGDVRAIKAVYRVDPDARIADRNLRERSEPDLQKAAQLAGAPTAVRLLAQGMAQAGEHDTIFFNPSDQG